MTSKLSLYNETLLLLGEEKLASLAEARAPRYALDDVWDAGLRYCLEQGFWNFAMRAVQADASASVTPTFGFAYAFTKPDDWIRTYQVGDNENLNPQLDRFVDEPNYWYADCDPLYVKYVSSDTAYGLDLSIWPETFANYVAHYFAKRTCKRITGGSPSDDLLRDEKRAKADARSKDAMNEPPGRPPTGSWVNSRGSSGLGSRWNRQFT